MVKIQEFARQHSIIIGACHAAQLETARLMASPFVPFVSSDMKKRTDPEASLAGVKSIIVIGVGQKIVAKPIANILKAGRRGILSSLGVDEDYHVRVRDLLKKLADELKASYGNFRHKILVDSPTLDERALAHRAGLGFFGRNGLIISPEFGSRFNIGLMLTDIPPEDIEGAILTPVAALSGVGCPPNCNLCIEHCPGNALGNDYLEASRCVSYLTQKKELTPEESALLGNHLYGCDICQDICPFNAPRETTYINPDDWLAMDDEAFDKEYGHTAMLWRGAELLRRNARIVKRG